jgi:hypothetical protein
MLGIPYDLGARSYGFTSPSGLTATTRQVQPGSLVVVVLLPNDANTQIVSFGGDGTGNQYTNLFNMPGAASLQAISIWYCSNTQFNIPVGRSLGPVATGDAGAWTGTAVAVTGANGGPDTFNFASSTGAVTSTSIATAATATGVPGLAFGFIISPTGNQYGSSGHVIVENITGGTSTIDLFDGQFYGIAYGIIPAGGTVTYNPSWPTANGYSIAVATFKGGGGFLLNTQSLVANI